MPDIHPTSIVDENITIDDIADANLRFQTIMSSKEFNVINATGKFIYNCLILPF